MPKSKKPRPNTSVTLQKLIKENRKLHEKIKKLKHGHKASAKEKRKKEYLSREYRKAARRYGFAKFVHGEPLEFLHKDGTIAVQPSILRHHADSESLWGKLDVAANSGDASFRKEAARVARQRQVTMREVYTFYISP